MAPLGMLHGVTRCGKNSAKARARSTCRALAIVSAYAGLQTF